MPVIFGFRFMRSLWIRCLVALLMLAFAGGTAAAAHPAGTVPVPEDCRLHAGTAQHDHHRHGPGEAPCCCCDCLGCLSAALLAPPLSEGPAMLAARAVRPMRSASLAERNLRPEPEPPRPVTLG